jgi:hypothetical protein
MQNEFLDTPTLDLTLAEAERRFGADDVTCAAVLGALVDAGVLARTPGGTYVRFVPRHRTGSLPAASVSIAGTAA